MNNCVSDISLTSLTDSQIESKIQLECTRFLGVHDSRVRGKGRWGGDHEAGEPSQLNK